jgi:ComF family protein
MEQLKTLAAKLWGKFQNELYPYDITCISCNAELRAEDYYGLCKKCIKKITLIDAEVKRCLKCGKPIYDEARYCITCQNIKRHFEKAYSFMVYKDTARTLMERYKFRGAKYIAYYFAKMLAVVYYGAKLEADVLVPVPINDKERGYNQSELLADFLSSLTGVPKSNALKKIKETRKQIELGGKDRQENLKGAFAAALDVKGKSILLIDDIITTGATMSECSHTLLKAGAERVVGLSVCNVEYYLYKEGNI